MRWRDWEDAWGAALYGPGGFVHAAGPPAAHFRTSVHVGPELAGALVELLARVDHGLGRPARLDLVDLGAGGGELLVGVVEQCPPALRARLVPLAVDVRVAPPGYPLPWTSALPDAVTGLVVAHEWLDALACPVVEHDGSAVRRVAVADDGTERLGPVPAGAVAGWLARWAPLGSGGRTEVGLPRDRAWAGVVSRLRAGVALAVDYGVTGPAATLAGFAGGRAVRPVPDGSCDLTAHVHWPSLVGGGRLRTQAAALRALGLRAPAPDPDRADWLAGAARAGRVAELTDPAGLGGYGWLTAAVGLPDPLRRWAP